MIIGIDGNEANLEERVGANQYAFEILWSLYKLQDEWKSRHQIVVYLKEKPKDFLPPTSNFFRYKIIPGKSLWILTRLMPSLLLGKEKPNVFFSPHHYLPPLAPMPLVCTIHDLGYLNFSGQFKKYDFWQLKIWSAISILISKGIIAVSESTKEEIVRHYPFASKKIEVVPHGYDRDKFNLKVSEEDVRRIKEKYSIVDDYILYISTLKPSKNVEGLIEAFSEVKNQFPKLKLVIAGKKGWLFESIFEKVKKLGLEGRIVFTGYFPEEDRPGLMMGAQAYILPSFWEGFGMEALNAMACGKPVIVSNVASLPEVVGEAGIYIDPYKVDSIAKAISKVLTLPKSDYNKIVEKGLKQVRKFSWEKSGRETLKVLEEAAKK